MSSSNEAKNNKPICSFFKKIFWCSTSDNWVKVKQRKREMLWLEVTPVREFERNNNREKKTSNRIAYSCMSPVQHLTESVFSFKTRILEQNSPFDHKKAQNRKRKMVREYAKYKKQQKDSRNCISWLPIRSKPSSKNISTNELLSMYRREVIHDKLVKSIMHQVRSQTPSNDSNNFTPGSDQKNAISIMEDSSDNSSNIKVSSLLPNSHPQERVKSQFKRKESVMTGSQSSFSSNAKEIGKM